MFAIRLFAPPTAIAPDAPQTTGQLVVGDTRLIFPVDLRRWRVVDYQRQWKGGIGKLFHGAPSSALMTGVRDHGDAPHTMWALWSESGRLYVQPHCVMPSELTEPFDPFSPYDHVGARVPVSEESLPMAEWSVELDQFFASVLNIRWPFAQ